MKVWDDQQMTPAVAMDISRKHIIDWQEALKRKKNLNQASPTFVIDKKVLWHPPDQGFVKLNVDAFLYIGEESFALGKVVRDEKGCFVKGKNMRLQGIVTVMDAEA